MSYKGGRRNNKNDNSRDNIQPEVALDLSNPVITQFQKYAIELDDKHDRHERLVKASRDITIESKRIIFLLHNIDPRYENKKFHQNSSQFINFSEKTTKML